MSEEQEEQAKKMAKMFMNPIFISAMIIFTYILVGFILSLLVSIFFRNPPRTYSQPL